MHKEAFSHLHRLFDGVRSVQSQPPKYSHQGSQFCSISLSPSPLRLERSVPSGVEFGASARPSGPVTSITTVSGTAWWICGTGTSIVIYVWFKSMVSLVCECRPVIGQRSIIYHLGAFCQHQGPGL